MHEKGRTVVGVIALVVLLVAGGAFIYSQQSGSSDDLSQSTSSPTTTAEDNFYSTSTNNNATATENTTGTDLQPSDTSQDAETVGVDQEVAAWKAAVDGGGSVRCEFDGQKLGKGFDMEFYVSSGKYYSERKLPENDPEKSEYAVVKNGNSYVWKEGASRASRLDSNVVNQIINSLIQEANNKENSAEIATKDDLIASDILACEKTSVNADLFRAPEGVTFPQP